MRVQKQKHDEERKALAKEKVALLRRISEIERMEDCLKAQDAQQKFEFESKQWIVQQEVERLSFAYPMQVTDLQKWAIRWAGQGVSKKHKVSHLFLMQLWEKQKGLCALSGRTMSLTRQEGEGRFKSSLASVDRIDSTLGYSEENVQLVCLNVNVMKKDMADEEFIKLCTDVADTRNIS